MNIDLLHRLRAAGGGFVPVEGLGADLDELQGFGFGLERHPFLGAAYRGPSPRLCPDQIEWELGTNLVGRRVVVWNRVGSTNDLAARAAPSRANEGLAVLAEEQTSGRGSRGRTWSSPPGSSVLMSVLLFPVGPLGDPSWLTALGAVAVAEVLDEEFALKARIKWPNDVRVDGRKLAGVLVERGRGTVLGIGLNVNASAEDFPEGLRDSATSLRRLLGRSLDRSEVARSLLRRLDHHYGLALAAGPDGLQAAYGRRSEHLGHRVEVATPAGPVVGRLEAIGLREGLTLALDGGDSRRVAIREVSAIVNRD